MSTKRWLYVKATEDTGAELWVTDGTAAGAQLLMDVWPGLPGSSPQVLWVMDDGRAVFSASDGVQFGAMWITDGTAAGTRILSEAGTGDVLQFVNFGAGSFTALGNGQALFNAYHSQSGHGLWITDGSDEGTRLVRGPDENQQAFGGFYPNRITALGDGQALFTASDFWTAQQQLWRTDGSTEGTQRLIEAWPGGYGQVEQIFSLGNGRALLRAYDSVNGYELWATDGTPEGTVLLQDIYPGNASSSPSSFVSLGNGMALFTAYNPDHGQAMWASDGTAEGTYRLIESASGAYSYGGQAMPLGDGRALLNVYSLEFGHELWVTDGTPDGTHILKDIVEGTNSSHPLNLFALGDGRVLFNALTLEKGHELWVSDGTPGGTQLVSDLWPDYGSSYPHDFKSLGQGRVLFRAQEATGTGYGYWVTDGTATHTVPLASLLPPGMTPVVTPTTPNLNGDGQSLMFQAVSSLGETTLWLTDGTAEGTRLVDTMQVGNASSYPYLFAALGDGRALFSANDSVHGHELWITDGSREGTQLLLDMIPTQWYSPVQDLEPLDNGRVLLSAYTPEYGGELWVSDGTADGTRLLKDIGSTSDSSSPAFLTNLGNGLVLMSAHTLEHGREVWVSDGTAEGTRLLLDIAAGPQSSYPHNFYAIGDGQALFSSQDYSSGVQTLWITDGTPEGTRMLAPDQLGSVYHSNFSKLGSGNASFISYDSVTYASELWFSDGTDAGTIGINELLGDRALWAQNLASAGLGDGRMLFSAQDATHGAELWVSDGTAEGTQLLSDLVPGNNSAYPHSFASLGDGRVLFYALDPKDGRNDLWVTDGSTDGTQRILDRPWWGGYQTPLSLGNGKAVFLVVEDISDNQVMWVSDGTAAGTHAIKDLNPYSTNAEIIDFTPLGDGRALFRSDDPVHGRELWITDGTSEGTQLVRDINVLMESVQYWELGGEVPNRAPTGNLQILGTPLQGETLSATFVRALADADGLGSLSHQWQVSGNGVDGWEDLPDATDNTFTPGQAEVGSHLRVRVSYTDGRGFEESVVSAATAVPVANVNDLPGGSVKLSGNEWVGQVLKATQDLSDIDGLGALTYDWQTYSTSLGEWVSLQEGDASQWTVGLEAVGQTVRVVVRYQDGGGTQEAVAAETARLVLNGVVTGDSAANLLMGTYGADALVGGTGNDTYQLNHLGDTVTERNNGGVDTVVSHLASLLMPAYVESAMLAAGGGADVTGNALDNFIMAGQGNNRMDGGAGKDTVSYETANAGVSIRLNLETPQDSGGSGLDALLRIENLVGSAHNDQLYGNTAANLLSGGAGDDTLSGDAGDDVLTGGLGADVLTGGAGKDWFVFDTATEADSVDDVRDFVTRSDKIVLDDDVFNALSGSVNGTMLSKSAFVSGTQATTASHRIIYDAVTGALSYDSDGAGNAAQVLIGVIWASATTHPQLNNADILIIA